MQKWYTAPDTGHKSSLALALLRCIYTEGQVFYDGLLTDNVNLDALRSSITIIPQSVSHDRRLAIVPLLNDAS